MDAGNISDLENTSNEVCVQVQGPESIYWDIYLDTITQIILGFVEKLPREMKQAIWLQTENGAEWESEKEDHDVVPFSRDDVVPYSDDDIAEYILHQYVLAAAGGWTNEVIRQYRDE